LPEGLELLGLLKPKMRRNRRGPGLSGTVAYMAKALRHSEDTLLEALAAIGLKPTEDADAKPDFVEADGQLYWAKQDSRGGVWINCRDQDKAGKKGRGAAAEADDASDDDDNDGEPDAAGDAGEEAAAAAAAEQAKGNVLAAARLLLTPKSRGAGFSAPVERIAEVLGKPKLEVVEALVKAGLSVPDDAKEKPVFAELGDEILWINRFARDESLWLNAKAKPKAKRGPRSRSRKADTETPSPEEDGAKAEPETTDES